MKRLKQRRLEIRQKIWNRVHSLNHLPEIRSIIAEETRHKLSKVIEPILHSVDIETFKGVNK